MDIQIAIRDLAAYAYRTGLTAEEDLLFLLNSLAAFFGLFEVSSTADSVLRKAATISETDIETGQELEALLLFMLEYRKKEGLSASCIDEDLSSRIMALLTPPPSEIHRLFREKYALSPAAATDWFFNFTKNCNYISRYQAAKSLPWASFTPYGDLELKILAPSDPLLFHPEEYSAYTEHAYPACILCQENIGYSGHLSYPSGRIRRRVPVTLQGKTYELEYLPGNAEPELFLLSSKKHESSPLSSESFLRLLEFIQLFPHFFIGLDADLPFAKAPLPPHECFLGGRFESALAKAPIERSFSVKGYKNVSCGIVKWPASVIRLTASDPKELASLADLLLKNWQSYSDEAASLQANTDGKKHHSLTCLARRRQEDFELDLILRSNLSDRAHPEGIFYPRRQYQHFIYRGIGLLELSGLMLFPWQLKLDLEQIEKALLEKHSLAATAEQRRHVDWAKDIRRDHKILTADNISSILRKEIGMAFLHMLEDSAVFKRNPAGQDAFDRFILSMEAVFDSGKED